MSTRTRKTKSNTRVRNGKAEGLSADEKAALKDRIRETQGDATQGEAAVLEKIAELSEPDRTLAKRIHTIVMRTAPALTPRTWYGMPAYAKDDKVLCFFKAGQKFKARYATLGFSDKAKLDDGEMWPTDFAVKELTTAVEARISALVKKAVG